MRRRALGVAATAMAVTLAGCGSSSSSGGGTPPGSPEPSGAQIPALVDALSGAVPALAAVKQDRVVDAATNECQEILAGSPSVAQARARFTFSGMELTDDMAEKLIAAVQSSPWCK